MHPVGDHVHRGVEVEVLPLGAARRGGSGPGTRGAEPVDELQARGALRAQPAAADRRVGVALDLDDPLVFDVDPLAAADRAVGADAAHDPIGRVRSRNVLRGAGGTHGRAATEPVRPRRLPDDRPKREFSLAGHEYSNAPACWAGRVGLEPAGPPRGRRSPRSFPRPRTRDQRALRAPSKATRLGGWHPAATRSVTARRSDWVTGMGNQLYGPEPNVAADAGWQPPEPRMGFFTDTSVCIGCKACEVACKEWNGVPDDGFNLLGWSYDNTGALGASTWRHVAFIEQPRRLSGQEPGLSGLPTGPSASEDDDGATSGDRTEVRWLMESDVCKHCTHAACLDVCPTGSLFRTEFGTVVVQDDICNGCGYCVPACPFGVIDRRRGGPDTKNVGLAQKCTLCYDRLGQGYDARMRASLPDRVNPVRRPRRIACARSGAVVGVARPRCRRGAPVRARPPRRHRRRRRHFPAARRARGVRPAAGSGTVTTRDLPAMWKKAGLAALSFAATAVAAFVGRSL